MDLWVIIVIVMIIIIILVIVVVLLFLYLCGFCDRKREVQKPKGSPKPKTPENYFLSPDLWKSPSLEAALKSERLAANRQKINENMNVETKELDRPKSVPKSKTTRSIDSGEKNDSKNTLEDNKA